MLHRNHEKTPHTLITYRVDHTDIVLIYCTGPAQNHHTVCAQFTYNMHTEHKDLKHTVRTEYSDNQYEIRTKCIDNSAGPLTQFALCAKTTMITSACARVKRNRHVRKRVKTVRLLANSAPYVLAYSRFYFCLAILTVNRPVVSVLK